MRLFFASIVLAGLSGCGPVLTPMMPVLGPDEQARVDRMWNNMLTPVRRVDRQTLLDANVAYMMFTTGVDRMHLVSEKYFKGGKVIMEMDCDRSNPAADDFSITVLDERGRTVRRERYTRAEVEDSADMLRRGPWLEQAWSATQPANRPGGRSAQQPATRLAETSQERKLRLEWERRGAAAAAATQPGGLKAAENR